MFKIQVLSQQNDTKFWNDTFSTIWEGAIDLSIQNNFQVDKGADLIVIDLCGELSNKINILGDISPNLVGKHFLIASDKKDADIAIDGIKLGAMGFLVKPFKRADLISCLDKLNSTPGGKLPTKRNAKIITMISYKGGTGVSTATANLGYTLANIYKKKTLIIDAAGFSNHITVLLNMIPKCTLADICKQGNELDESYLNNAVSTLGPNLGVIGGLLKTSDFGDINISSLEHLLKIADEVYDFILVDTPSHSLDEITMLFIEKSNDLLLMTTFDLLAIRDNRFFIQTLKELGISENKIKPIINRQDWYIGSLEPELIQKQINHNIFHSLPNDWNLSVEAANYGRPVLEVSPNSQLATSYKILGGKISKSDIPEHHESPELHTAEATRDKKKGLLSWF